MNNYGVPNAPQYIPQNMQNLPPGPPPMPPTYNPFPSDMSNKYQVSWDENLHRPVVHSRSRVIICEPTVNCCCNNAANRFPTGNNNAVMGLNQINPYSNISNMTPPQYGPNQPNSNFTNMPGIQGGVNGFSNINGINTVGNFAPLNQMNCSPGMNCPPNMSCPPSMNCPPGMSCPPSMNCAPCTPMNYNNNQMQGFQSPQSPITNSNFPSSPFMNSSVLNSSQMYQSPFQQGLVINPMQSQQLQQQLAYEAEALRFKLEQERIMRSQQYQLKFHRNGQTSTTDLRYYSKRYMPVAFKVQHCPETNCPKIDFQNFTSLSPLPLDEDEMKIEQFILRTNCTNARKLQLRNMCQNTQTTKCPSTNTASQHKDTANKVSQTIISQIIDKIVEMGENQKQENGETNNGPQKATKIKRKPKTIGICSDSSDSSDDSNLEDYLCGCQRNN